MCEIDVERCYRRRGLSGANNRLPGVTLFCIDYVMRQSREIVMLSTITLKILTTYIVLLNVLL